MKQDQDDAASFLKQKIFAIKDKENDQKITNIKSNIVLNNALVGVITYQANNYQSTKF